MISQPQCPQERPQEKRPGLPIPGLPKVGLCDDAVNVLSTEGTHYLTGSCLHVVGMPRLTPFRGGAQRPRCGARRDPGERRLGLAAVGRTPGWPPT